MAHALWTIGHSTRDWDTFVALLQAAQIKVLADVRRFAGSRRHPQFSGEAMARELPVAGIAYVPMPALGGRRPAQPGFAEHGLAQCQLPRLCRLHGHR